jgi:hypothetical protein
MVDRLNLLEWSDERPSRDILPGAEPSVQSTPTAEMVAYENGVLRRSCSTHRPDLPSDTSPSFSDSASTQAEPTTREGTQTHGGDDSTEFDSAPSSPRTRPKPVSGAEQKKKYFWKCRTCKQSGDHLIENIRRMPPG